MTNQNPNEHRLPLLIVVSGAPGAGKTTFARALANEMKILHFERDRLFWSVEFTTGITKLDRQKVGIPLFYKVVEQLLSDKLSLIIDGTLYKGASEKEIGQLQSLADMVNVHCRAKNTTQRFHDRLVPKGEATPEWIEKHMEHLEKIKPFVEHPLEIDWDVIEVDTNGTYKPSIKEIADQLRYRQQRQVDIS
jgi:2-phosphoglycerate kinase